MNNSFLAMVLGATLPVLGGAALADSPRQALLAQDTAARSGNVDADLEFYQARGEKQQKLAEAIARGDVALAKLQEAVAKQFGDALATAVIHAAGTEDDHDIQSAEEKIDADQATIEFKDHSAPVHMVKVDGNWKISLTDMLGETTDLEVEQLTKAVTEFTTEIGHITELVQNRKFRSGEGVRDRVGELRDRLFKTDAPAGGQGV